MGAEDFTYTDFWHGFTSSSALIGCIIGSALSGVLASNWGRKRSLIFGPKNLPKLGKMFGKTINGFKKGMEDEDAEQSEETVKKADKKDEDEE